MDKTCLNCRYCMPSNDTYAECGYRLILPAVCYGPDTDPIELDDPKHDCRCWAGTGESIKEVMTLNSLWMVIDSEAKTFEVVRRANRDREGQLLDDMLKTKYTKV